MPQVNSGSNTPRPSPRPMDQPREPGGPDILPSRICGTHRRGRAKKNRKHTHARRDRTNGPWRSSSVAIYPRRCLCDSPRKRKRRRHALRSRRTDDLDQRGRYWSCIRKSGQSDRFGLPAHKLPHATRDSRSDICSGRRLRKEKGRSQSATRSSLPVPAPQKDTCKTWWNGRKT